LRAIEMPRTNLSGCSVRGCSRCCAPARDREGSRDLSHDVLISVLGALRKGQLRDHGKLAGFIHGAARHTVQAYQRGQNTREQPLEDEPIADIAVDAIEDSERQGLVREALRQLDPTDQEILARTLVDGQKPGHIATALGLTSEVVRQRKSRATKKVAERIKKLTQNMELRRHSNKDRV
jgi:RNA polymerase sigma factor (sigma-70 family)